MTKQCQCLVIMLLKYEWLEHTEHTDGHMRQEWYEKNNNWSLLESNVTLMNPRNCKHIAASFQVQRVRYYKTRLH